MLSLKALEAQLNLVSSDCCLPSSSPNALGVADEELFLSAILQCAKEHPVNEKEIIVHSLLRLYKISSNHDIINSLLDNQSGNTKLSLDRKVANRNRLEINISYAIRSYFINEFQTFSKNIKDQEMIDFWHLAALYNFGIRLLPFTEVHKISTLEQKSRLKQIVSLYFGAVPSQKSLNHLVHSFIKFSTHLINQVKQEIKVISMLQCPNYLFIWDDLNSTAFELLNHELENIVTQFEGDSGSLYDNNCSVSPQAPSSVECKSDLRSSGNMLVQEDDNNDRFSGFCIRHTELLLDLFRCCKNTEENLTIFAVELRDRVMPVLKLSQDISSHFDLSAEIISWEWRSFFRPFIGDIINAMNLDICFYTLTIMEEEWNTIQVHRNIKTTFRPMFSKTGCSSILVLQSAAVLIDAIQKYSVFALPSVGILMPLRSTFVTCMKQQFIEMKNHLLRINRLVTHSCITSLLYPTLGSVMVLKNCLMLYMNKNDFKSDFEVIINDMVSVQEVILEQICESHKQILATSVLHDDDSNSWADSKPFYENERCSFSIQMWKYYVQALQRDLWLNVPCHEIQDIYVAIIKYSLELLVTRYSTTVVSFSRTKQLRADVTAVLLFTKEILTYMVTDLSSFFGYCKRINIRSIHNLCTSLLMIAVVVTAPLKVLYKECTNQSSTPDSHQGVDERALRSKNMKWLQVSQQPKDSGRAQHLANVFFIRLRILLHQPVMDSCALLQILIDSDAKLSKMLLGNPALIAEPLLPYNDECILSRINTLDSCRLNNQFWLLYILAHCSSSNECFSDVFIHALDSTWYAYLDYLGTDAKLQVPFWFDVLYTLLQPFLQNIIQKVMFCILENVNLEESLRLGVAELFNTFEVKDKFDILVDTFIDMLPIMKMSLIQIPDTVCILFSKLNDSYTKRYTCTHTTSVVFKIINAMLERHLSVVLETMTPVAAHFNNNIDVLRQYQKLLLNMCNPNHKVTDELRDTLIGRYAEIEVVAEYINNYITVMASKCIKKASFENKCANPNCLLAVDSEFMLSSATGKFALQAIYQLLINNQQWIYRKFVVEDNASLYPSERLQQTNYFNPFVEYEEIGTSGCTFTLASLGTIVFDWEDILKNEFGLTNLSISTLISHRWEFQSDLSLNDKEREFVATLRQLYLTVPKW